MPIFTSRFSPERSLVGAFLSPKSRETDDAESKKEKRQTDSASSSRASQAKDRLEITGRQQAETVSVRTSEQTHEARVRETGQKDAQQLSLRRSVREISIARTSLLPSAQESTPSIKTKNDASNAPVNQAASENAVPTRLETLVSRLGDLRIENALKAIQNENAQAAQTAGPKPLEALVEQVEQSEQPVVETPVAIALDEAEKAPALARPERIDRVVEQLQKQAPAAPERDVQEADLRRNLKTIATGLQADAAIESRRTIEQTARNAEVATEKQQQDTIRDNQTEIRSLQTSRRSLHQEVQKTDQAIRQLQSETSRIQNSTPATSGTSIDILAQ